MSIIKVDHDKQKIMLNNLNQNAKNEPGQPVVYQIRIKGHLGSLRRDWFDGLTITLEDNGNTLLTGPVIDQAALYGLIRRVRDLGLPLLSVNPVKAGPGMEENQEII